jgi:hypothetical protein
MAPSPPTVILSACEGTPREALDSEAGVTPLMATDFALRATASPGDSSTSSE